MKKEVPFLTALHPLNDSLNSTEFSTSVCCSCKTKHNYDFFLNNLNAQEAKESLNTLKGVRCKNYESLIKHKHLTGNSVYVFFFLNICILLVYATRRLTYFHTLHILKDLVSFSKTLCHCKLMPHYRNSENFIFPLDSTSRMATPFYPGKGY